MVGNVANLAVLRLTITLLLPGRNYKCLAKYRPANLLQTLSLITPVSGRQEVQLLWTAPPAVKPGSFAFYIHDRIFDRVRMIQFEISPFSHLGRRNTCTGMRINQ